MAALRATHKALGLARQREQPLGKPNGHDAVLLAMQHQERRRHPPDALVRMKFVLHKPAHRREWIGGGAYLDGGGERRIEDHARVGRFTWLTADGIGLLALCYRGYGGSTGLSPRGATNQAISFSPSPLVSVTSCACGSPACAGRTWFESGKYSNARWNTYISASKPP